MTVKNPPVAIAPLRSRRSVVLGISNRHSWHGNQGEAEADFDEVWFCWDAKGEESTKEMG
jgi:hypothetical protein